MKASEIINEIERLPIRKQMYVIEKTIHTIGKQEDKNMMIKAAKALYADYNTDKELTAFTKFDFEGFYEAR